jgi:hypothetical protein
MRRAILPLATLMGLAWLAVGTLVSTPNGPKETPTVKTGRSAAPLDIARDEEPLRADAAPEIKIIKISGDQTGNKRYPGVGENRRGDRLVIFRGPNSLYWYSFCPRGGSWSKSAAIPNQLKLENHTHTDVAADSTGRFHCVWEEPDVTIVYASFLDGVWTTPKEILLPGKHDMGVQVAVRSNDEVIVANADVIRSPYLTKDVFFFFKKKGESTFTRKNMTTDPPSSNNMSIAIDDKDHIWLAHKAEPKVGSDELVIRMHHYRQDNEEVEDKTVTDPEGWHFCPQIAINPDGMLMIGWAHTQNRSYEWRLYNTKTKKWSEVYTAGPGIPVSPWGAFWSKMVAHGNDFYWAVMDSGRVLHLLKFDAKANDWDDLGVVSKGAVEYHDMYSGYDKLLIAWSENQDPTDVFLTTVAVTPAGPTAIRIAGEVGVGSAGLSGVTMSGLPGNPVTDDTGFYSADVDEGWTGTVVPKKTNYVFAPSSREYTEVTSSKVDQDYEATRQFTLTISASAGGTTNPAPAAYYHDPNSNVTVRAVPSANYRFINWTLDASGAVNPITMKLDKNKSIRANFFRVKSVVNLSAEKRVERSFFRGYDLNVLTWAANPENAAQGIAVSAHRVYRKTQEEDSTQWVRIAELPGTAVKYEDRNVPKGADLIYAVTCVDDLGNESSIY